jgi:transposase
LTHIQKVAKRYQLSSWVCGRHDALPKDRDDKKLVHTNIRNNDFEFFLKLVAPYRHDLTVCAECMFGWYWLADACQVAALHFVLAHVLYLKAIHGGKNKNDRIDSEKLAHLLRSNLIPPRDAHRSHLPTATQIP